MKKNHVLPASEKYRLLEIELTALRTKARRLSDAAARAETLCDAIDELEKDFAVWQSLAMETAKTEEVR